MTGRDYWRAEYGAEFKTCLAPAKHPRMTQNPKNVSASTSKLPLVEPPDVSHGAGYDSDLSDVFDRDTTTAPGEPGDYSDDDSACDLAFWFAGEEDWPSHSRQAPIWVRTKQE